MADDEQLVLEVLAKIGDLEKNMKRANAITSKAFTDMMKQSRTATKQMEIDMTRSSARVAEAAALTGDKVGAVSRAISTRMLAGATVVGLALMAVKATLDTTITALEEFGDIADKSAQSGLDAETFQELAYGASLAGVGMDELSASLNTFSKNAGLAVVGKGKMVAALQKLNPALLENIRNAKTQEERVRLAADAIDKAKTASEKAALATTLFGNAGAKLVPVFDGGSAALARTAQKAQELGIIVNNQLIARADELGDEFATATKVMDIQFKQALIELAPLLVKTAEVAAWVGKAINGIVESMRSLDNQSMKSLETGQTENALKRLELEAKIFDLKKQEAGGAITLMDQGVLAGLQAQRDALKAQDIEYTKIIAKRREAAEIAKKMSGDGSGDDGDEILPPIKPGGSTRDNAADEAIRQAEAVKQLIDNLRFEQSLIGRSELDQAKMTALRQAGAKATTEQKEEIERLIEAKARETAANEANAQSIQLQRDVLSGTMTDVRTAAMDGKITAEEWRDVWVNAIGKVADAFQTQLVNALIPSSGGFNIFSLLFGGAGAVAGGGAPAGGGGVPSAPIAANAPKALAGAKRAASQAARGPAINVNVRAVSDGVNLGHEVEVLVDGRVAKRVPAMIKEGIKINNRNVMPDLVRKIASKPRDKRA